RRRPWPPRTRRYAGSAMGRSDARHRGQRLQRLRRPRVRSVARPAAIAAPSRRPLRRVSFPPFALLGTLRGFAVSGMRVLASQIGYTRKLLMPNTMQALRKTRPARGLSLESAAVPAIGPTDVLVRVKAASICGTDLHIYGWDRWSQSRIKPPVT